MADWKKQNPKKQQQNQYLLDRKEGMRNCRMWNMKTHASLGLAQKLSVSCI